MEPFAAEFFDKNVADRLKDAIDHNDYYSEGRGINPSLRDRMVLFLRRINRSYIVPEFRSSFDEFVEELATAVMPEEEPWSIFGKLQEMTNRMC